MPRDPIYLAGDRLDDGKGSVAYVCACTSTRTGAVYLKAKFETGPRAGEWIFPEKVGLPLLDWRANGDATVCRECERTFKGGLDTHALPHLLCRTCAYLDDQRAARRGSEPSVGFQARRPRVFRR